MPKTRSLCLTIDRKRAQVIYIMYASAYASICAYFGGFFSGLKSLREVKVVPYGRAVDNKLVRHALPRWIFQRERDM